MSSVGSTAHLNSTAATYGEPCTFPGCLKMSRKRFFCPHHEKSFLCPTHAGRGCRVCHSARGEYRTDSDTEMMNVPRVEELVEEDISQRTRVQPLRYLEKLMADDFDAAIDQLNPLLQYLQLIKAIACINAGDTEVTGAEERDELLRKAKDAASRSADLKQELEDVVTEEIHLRSIQNIQIQQLLRDLEKLVGRGDFDEGILQLNQFLSYLQFMKANALHGKAGVADMPGYRKREMLGKAYYAVATSVTLFRELKEDRDEEIYAHALTLQANLAARLGKSSGKQVLDQARVSANEAIAILRQLEISPATAIRVLGVISMNLDDFLSAKKRFLESILEFRKSGQEYESFWCAVAYFNVHIALKELGASQELLPWLKRAIEIRERIEGNSPYSKMYREKLEKLLDELGMTKIPANEPVTLSKQENDEIENT